MESMKRTCLPLIVLVLFTATPSRAALVLRLDLPQLVQRAERVVVARLVKAGPSFWRGTRIFTTYTFSVERQVAGTGGRQVVVVQPGGQVGRLRQVVSGYPAFPPGRSLLLFLSRAGGAWRVVGLSQGVFELVLQKGHPVWRQRLEGVRSPRGEIEPLDLDPAEGLARIGRLWQTRQARP